MLPWFTDRSADTATREAPMSKRVRDDMLGMILRGQLEPGQRINEPDVAARLGTSRVPVREALRELESSGLVVARKHAGVFVRQLDRVEIGHLYELRALLEGHAGARAAQMPQKKRRALGATLAGTIAEMTAAADVHDVPRYHVGNLRFHWALIESADNPAFATTCQGVIQQLHVYRLQNLSRDPGMGISIDEHRLIRDAVREGDADRCRTLQASHVGDAWRRLNI